MLPRTDMRTRAFVGAVALAITLAAVPGASATPHKAVIEEAVVIKLPGSVAKKRKSRGWGGHSFAWHFTPRRMISKAAIALATARAQLGKPYVWAAAGPNSFDCSGLTMYAWHAAGVDLPHNSYAQQDAIKAVPIDKMQPGDLVFYPGHVGMYIGHGQMIHAPYTGANVEIAPLQADIIGAGRPA